MTVNGDHPASLAGPDGSVLLSPHGARVLHLFLEAVMGPRYRDGGRPPDDLAYLREVLCLAVNRADGCAHETPGTPFRVTLPASNATITVAEAAQLWGTTPQNVTKAIRSGKLQARKHGPQWLVNEFDARHRAPERRHRRGERGRQSARDSGSGEGWPVDPG